MSTLLLNHCHNGILDAPIIVNHAAFACGKTTKRQFTHLTITLTTHAACVISTTERA